MDKQGRIIEFHKGLLCSDLFFLSKAISKDETRYFMNFAYCKGETIAATDGRRLHIIKNNIEMQEGHFLYVLKSTATKFIGFEFEDDMQFPNIDRVIPDKNEMACLGEHESLFLGSLLYKVNKEANAAFNIDYMKDLLLIGGHMDIYADKNDSGNKAFLFESGNNSAVVMPLDVRSY